MDKKSLKIGRVNGVIPPEPLEKSSGSLAFKKSEELRKFEQQCLEYI